jgi:hypothetical protein
VTSTCPSSARSVTRAAIGFAAARAHWTWRA